MKEQDINNFLIKTTTPERFDPNTSEIQNQTF